MSVAVILTFLLTTVSFFLEIWFSENPKTMTIAYALIFVLCIALLIFSYRTSKKPKQSEKDIYSANKAEVIFIIDKKLERYEKIKQEIMRSLADA